jgi:exodeoxyribonuclease VII large subunit
MVGEVLTVRGLLDELADAVGSRFPGVVWVEGEVAEMSRSRNGHVYFDLVDRDEGGRPVARVPVVLWASVRDHVNRVLRRVGSIRIGDGVRIRISGRLEVYAPRGQVQLVMQGIDPTYTLGLLATERERVRQLLEAEGLAHRNRALPVPLLPLHIALVTARTSAAEADVLQTLDDSGLAWRVLQIDARVQGPGSETDVVAALVTAARHDVDLVCVVRGGGARNDLATFDHEAVARAIATLPVPVWVGIGHETDQSVADLVANRSERTPTACAHALVAHARAGADRAEVAWAAVAAGAARVLSAAGRAHERRASTIGAAARERLDTESHRLDASRRHLRRGAPASVGRAEGVIERAAGRAAADGRAHLRTHAHRVDAANAALASWAPRALRAASRHLDGVEGRVAALDPRRALARGWSITRTQAGTVVRHHDDVAAGDTLVTTVLDGDITSTVAASERREPDPTAPGEPEDSALGRT